MIFFFEENTCEGYSARAKHVKCAAFIEEQTIIWVYIAFMETIR
jgi:hypothetical protein